MSTTTNIQNLLVNVFRPVYVYDPISQLFQPKLELSNVDTYIGNSTYVLRAQVGDSNSNVYVGVGSGNDPTVSTRGCFNVTAVGYNAGSGISNVSNSVYLGFGAGQGAQGATNVIAIGANANGNGTSNIYIGSNTGGAGSNNIYIGHGIAPGAQSNSLQVGSVLYGNSSNQWLGIYTPTAYSLSNTVDVSGSMYVTGKMGIQRLFPSKSLEVNGQTLSTGGFVSVQSNVSAAVGTTNIGLLQRGQIIVTAIDQASSANRATYTFFAYTTSNATAILSNISGDTNISISGSNIQISNASTTKTYDYSITYFPLA